MVCTWVHADGGALVMEWARAEDTQVSRGSGGDGARHAFGAGGRDAQRPSVRGPGQAARQEHAMSLSHREERQLRLIEAGLLRSDRHLGAMLGVFGRLCPGQGMPAREQAQARPGREADDRQNPAG